MKHSFSKPTILITYVSWSGHGCFRVMGVYEVKSRKGLIRVHCTVHDNIIEDIRITGDFFMYPEEKLWDLEEKLRGTPLDRLREKLVEYFDSLGIRLVGSTIDDFYTAINCACTGLCGD